MRQNKDCFCRGLAVLKIEDLVLIVNSTKGWIMAGNNKGSGCGKWALGCGVSGLILVIVLGLGVHFGLKWLGFSMESFKRFGELDRLNSQVTDQSAYVPPSDLRLTEGQVEKFVVIQRVMKDSMEQEASAFETSIKELESKFKGTNVQLSPREAVRYWNDLSQMLVNVKRVQVEAINAEELSLEEYRWVASQALAAMGMPNVVMDITNPKKMMEAGETQAEAVPVHPENAKLIMPHQELLSETLLFALFGM